MGARAPRRARSVDRRGDPRPAGADRGGAAVIDLSQVTFIDSAVLTELIASRRGREDGGGARLAIVAPPGGFPARVLGPLQLDQVVAVYESRGDALAAFEPG